MKIISRRSFVKKAGITSLALSHLPIPGNPFALDTDPEMKLGLVTYQWGKDWKLDKLITNCEKANIGGVELRKDHAHGVEPHLSKSGRNAIKQRFADSPVKLVGFGPNYNFDHIDPDKLKQNIQLTKQYVQLSHDTGGSGVKIKPDGFHKEIPHEKTIEQIGNALNELGIYAADHGQEIRLEVHGKETSELPNIKAIMDVADHPNVGVCWNCNDEDLKGEGLEYNFNLVKDRFGSTVHVRELNTDTYPYQDLMRMFVKMNYNGWILLECRTNPKDKVKALIEQQQIFNEMIEKVKNEN